MTLHIIESNSFSLDGGSMFGHAPKALWSKWVIVDEKNLTCLSTRALLWQTQEGKNILFEPGLGPFFDPKLRERYGIAQESALIENLEKQGFKEEDIDMVFLSHLHFDHAGALLTPFEEGPLKLRFPKATYYIGQTHFESAKNPHLREKVSFIPQLIPLLEGSKRLKLINGKTHPDFSKVTFSLSDGHTKGLLIAHIELDDGHLTLPSDLIPGMPWIHLPIITGFDRFAEKVVDEKEKLLNEVLEKKGKLLFFHDPKVTFVSLKKEADKIVAF